MAELKSKIAFGNRSDIETAKAANKIDEYDIIHTNDTHEVAWIDKNGETIFSTTRTQEPIAVNGVTSLGIANGETIPSGKSLDEIVKMLVQKAVPATYTRPSLSLGNNGGVAAGNVEAGTTVTPKLKATFSQNDAGALTAISISKGETVVKDGTVSPLDYVGDDIVIGDETVSFTASATYGDAPVKKNNLGDDSKENWFAGATIKSSAFSYVGKRNLFYGTGVGEMPELISDVIRALVNKKLAPANGLTFTMNVDVGQQYILIAYPATLRDINNITYVEANDSGMAENFTKETVNVADARGSEEGLMEYKVFSYKMAVPAAAAMTFKVTI